MILKVKTYSLALAFTLASTQMQAQATKENNDPDADFKLAKELYQKDQFSLAYPLFKMLYYGESRPESSIPVTIQLESKYYSIVCGLRLNDLNAEKAAREFIDLEHNTPRIQMMCFFLGEYYYRKKDFINAVAYYERTDFDNLSNSQIAEMKFHQGYAYFTMKRFNDAKPLFNTVRQMPSDPNYIDANYYYGFIAFNDKDYKGALESFKIVENQPAYQAIVPYYVAEIHYFNGDKDKAIDYGEASLTKGKQYYDLQLRQLIGHALFEKKQYAKALPYLEQYVSNTEKVRREDLYELSYCYYEAKQLNKAIAGFKELGGKEDSLAQNSMYLLGDAYLRTGQKSSARSAFLFCALNSSNKVQKEISSFNYGKLSYELGYQDAALTELQNFIGNYPTSTYLPEAKELLVNVLANTNNYKDALNLFQSLTNQSQTVKRVYPRILYGRAVELINDQQLQQADDLLNRVFAVPFNEAQLAPTYFWKGEIAYRMNKPDSAIYFLTQYLLRPVSYGEVNTVDARYTLGYSYLRIEDYQQALNNFEQIATSVSPSSTNIQYDAFVRSADCYFMQKRYPKALQMYETVINNNYPSADYAYFQKAIIAGANNQPQEKINILKSFPQRYASSNLVGETNMELADSYMSKEDFKEALAPLSIIINGRNTVSLKPQAYLKQGICYFNLDQETDALNSFKTLISAYKNSAESDVAVEYIRSIFVHRQQPTEFVAFMRQNGKNVSYSEEDSLVYASANLLYLNNNKSNALKGFENYLSKFPDGRYSIDAHFFCGEIYADQKNFSKALPHYEFVAAKAPNKFAEPAVLQSARIYYFEEKNYAKAKQYFDQLRSLATDAGNKLESMRGLLRCQYKLAEWTDAVPNAQDLLLQKGIATDDKMMANMVIAKNDQANNQLNDALNVYRAVIALGKSEYAAEARYRVAEILTAQNKLKEAEKAGFDVINKAGSYDYWITKAYILLGEIYFQQKDYFNAEATLKSVSENASNPELQQEAKQKLDVVITEKNKNSKVAQ